MANKETRIINRLSKWGWGHAVTISVDESYSSPYAGLTDLEFAATHGRIGIIKDLLEAGADVNAKSPTGLGATPLRAAVTGGCVEAVQLLIDFGADLEAKDLLSKTCLFTAVDLGYGKVLQVLLDAGANVNASDKWGMTPLMYAISYNSIEFVKILLVAGANVKAIDIDGRTVLDFVPSKRLFSVSLLGDFYSRNERNKEMVQLLEEAGAGSGV